MQPSMAIDPITVGSLLSVNVGRPRNVPWNGRTVFTGIWKSPVPGPQRVRRSNIDGDGQGDTGGHGGPNRAVMVYQLQSYRYWQQHLRRDDLSHGQFGENFTVDGLADTEVCIGDRYRIGTAEFEVSQPRVTCFRVGLRLGRPDMPSLLVAHRRPGFYLRVITEGVVTAGDDIVKTADGPHRLSVADVDALLYLPRPNLERIRTALDVAALSPGWLGSFRDLLAAAASGAPAAAGVIAPEPAWLGFRPLRIIAITPESRTVTSFRLADPAGTTLPAAAAGQYVTIRIPLRDGPVVRSYSLSGAPDTVSYRISVKRETAGVASAWLHDRARVGDTIEVAAPRGEFVLAAGDGPVALVSAGVGATPVLAMLHHLVATGSRRAIWWFHAARDPAEQAFGAEVAGLIDRLSDAHLQVRFSGRAGRLDADAFRAAGVPTDTLAYVCGPGSFMRDMTAALVAAGVDPGHIRTELFGARSPVNPGVVDARTVPPHPPSGPPGAGPTVTFARSGLSVPSDPRLATLLDLAEACDVPTRWSCRTGVCHTCSTPLLAGEVSYRTVPLDPPAPGQALLCCAAARTDLVLDL
jgi:ferredoxin-NADP reductase/MOSC domain-containing protein YiiM